MMILLAKVLTGSRKSVMKYKYVVIYGGGHRNEKKGENIWKLKKEMEKKVRKLLKYFVRVLLAT